MTIPTLPSAPLVTDTPADFNTKAFAWTAALEDWTTEANATGVAVGANATTASGAATTATTQAGIASSAATTATTQAGIASSAATTATTQAGIATSGAGTATTQAGIATTQATNAANSAASIVRNGSGGVAGLTLFKLDLRNAANTITSWFTTAATVARTWTMPNKDGTVAMISDITGTNSGTNTGDETGARIATLHHAASAKSALVDADEVTGGDSASGFSLIRTTWTDVKTFLKTYFDTLYQAVGTYVTPTTLNNGSLPASVTTLAASGNTTLGDASTDTLNVGNGGIIKDASGNVGFGGSPATGESFRMVKAVTGAVSAISMAQFPTINSDVTSAAYIYRSAPYTQSALFTLENLIQFQAINVTLQGASAVTVQHGFNVNSGFISAGTNYAFFAGDNSAITAGKSAFAYYSTANIASGGGTAWGLYMAGTAPNRFVGETLVIGAAGLGYGTGAGGTVTQATSRTTGVTLSKPTGKITLFSTTTTTGTFASFTLTNTLIAATDVVIVNFASATSADKYSLFVTAVAAGSCRIQVYNIAAVAVAEAPVINFAVIKGATS